MTLVEVKIAPMGEGIFEVTIIRWLVKEGDVIEQNSPLAEIATDKVDSEIVAPQRGSLKKILRQNGEIVRIGEVVALLQTTIQPEETQAAGSAGNTEERGNTTIEVKTIQQEGISDGIPPFSPVKGNSLPGLDFAKLNLSPFVRKVASDLGLSIEELAIIRGTSVSGRITRDDLYRYLDIKRKNLTNLESTGSTNSLPPNTPATDSIHPIDQTDTEVRKMDRTRKLIAEHMVKSKFTAPHVTSFYEADLTGIVQWREKVKDTFREKYGERLTFTPLFAEASAHALTRYPQVNVSLDGDNILVKKSINIGIATALSDGNLIVPVIHHADRLNLQELASAVNDLTQRARNGNLRPEEISGGTFTVTNLGMFNSLTGTPIIHQPESAILAIGVITRKPSVVLISGEESIGIRHLCILSLSYDHRIIDGALAGMFLKEIASSLENIDPERPI